MKACIFDTLWAVARMPPAPLKPTRPGRSRSGMSHRDAARLGGLARQAKRAAEQREAADINFTSLR